MSKIQFGQFTAPTNNASKLDVTNDLDAVKADLAAAGKLKGVNKVRIDQNGDVYGSNKGSFFTSADSKKQKRLKMFQKLEARGNSFKSDIAKSVWKTELSLLKGKLGGDKYLDADMTGKQFEDFLFKVKSRLSNKEQGAKLAATSEKNLRDAKLDPGSFLRNGNLSKAICAKLDMHGATKVTDKLAEGAYGYLKTTEAKKLLASLESGKVRTGNDVAPQHFDAMEKLMKGMIDAALKQQNPLKFLTQAAADQINKFSNIIQENGDKQELSQSDIDKCKNTLATNAFVLRGLSSNVTNLAVADKNPNMKQVNVVNQYMLQLANNAPGKTENAKACLDRLRPLGADLNNFTQGLLNAKTDSTQATGRRESEYVLDQDTVKMLDDLQAEFGM